MPDEQKPNKTITAIVASESVTRGYGDKLRDRLVEVTEINVTQLSTNVNIFVSQIGDILQNTPSKVGNLQLSEIEVSVEITASGQVVLLGVGGEVGVTGGLKFVFKRE